MKNSTAIILILASIGLSYTFTNSQYQGVKNLRVEASEYQNILQNASSIVETRNSLQKKYQSLPKDEINRLEKALPDGIDNVWLALDLETIASKYGISISKVDVDKGDNSSSAILGENSANPYDEVTVTFSFISNYNNFRRFLADLESSLRIADIESISFQVGTTGFYEHKISVKTYWLK